ncbi:MAG: ATP-dependent helicase [bacterium]
MKKYILASHSNDSRLDIDFRAALNEEQHSIVTTSDGPCLVLAGAGSGKTRVLVYRLLYLLSQGVNPHNILLVTFTNKAAKEMMSRVESLCKVKPEGLWGGTFHSVGNRILRQYGEAIGLKSNFIILDSDDSSQLVKSCYTEADVPKDKYFPKADLVHKIISLAVNLNLSIEDVIVERFPQIDQGYIQVISNIGARYQQKKQLANAVDYDDLLSKWLELLMKHPNVCQKLSEKFEYLLVDEYQDTNYLQGAIISYLSGRRKNVLVVGDDSQSIYSFRGADVNNIFNFPKDFLGCKIFRLETNYRSVPEILSLANHSISHNEHKFKKTLRTHKPSGDKPALVALQDNYQQADFICQRILELQKEDGWELKNMAVLFRSHYHSMELEMELNKRNISYVMRGGLRFFEQAHVKDVVSFIRVLVNHRDELSWLRLLMMQSGIGEANAKKLFVKISQFESLKEVLAHDWDLELSGKILVGYLSLNKILVRLFSGLIDEVGEVIKKILESNYIDYLKSNFDNYQERLEDLEQMVIFANSYKAVDKFLADVALSEGFKKESGANKMPIDAIVLSTIHQAKGLEWKAVFVMNLADGQFPSVRVFDKPREIEEERRLFYVAVTRAEDQLYLTYPLISARTDNVNSISQFIKELPKDVYEQWTVSRHGAAYAPHNCFSDSDEEVIVRDEDGEDLATDFWTAVMNKRKQK